MDHVDVDPKGIARRVAQAYGISRQAANRHLDALVDAGILDQAGQTRAREYALRRTSTVSRELRVTPVLSATRVWDEHVGPILAGDRPLVRDTCRGLFKELVDNAVAHAGASWISFEVMTTARQIDVNVRDDGRGIFAALAETLPAASAGDAATEFARRASARSMESPSARLVLLARSTEAFSIASSGVACTFDASDDSWSVIDDETAGLGTSISFRLKRIASRARADAVLMQPSSRR